MELSDAKSGFSSSNVGKFTSRTALSFKFVMYVPESIGGCHSGFV